MHSHRSVAVLLFDEAEVLDVCGPFEVLSVAGPRGGPRAFEVGTVAQLESPVTLRGGLRVIPTWSFSTAPALDLLIIPGGPGAREQMNNLEVIRWIRAQSQRTEVVASVCTGALLLAKAGLLEGAVAITHHLALELLQEAAPTASIRETARFVDNGRTVLSAGVAAGIDMSLHLVSRYLGEATARETASYLEYPWAPEPPS